ncbi:TIR domain-containing protein [Paenibacillus agricola]|uniref:Thoeris protein ThsB TIR-like domain-containing protein n=1 Tax=Paenibacillus agricola TaxID=2716264 RepID=A0ABX0JHB1_9BACL|nr:TIR domain-containing protein [Paenibacillus agricola]NHN33236.1 hypothetical protein [Paenibacillus agricola]
MKKIKTYKLYFSHGWNHQNTFEEVTALLIDKKEFNFSPSYVPDQEMYNHLSENDMYQMIRNKVKFCDMVILMCGVYNIQSFSRWINKEIICAKGEFSKPIIGIHRSPDLKLSIVERQNADMILEWDVDKLISTIQSIT